LIVDDNVHRAACDLFAVGAATDGVNHGVAKWCALEIVCENMLRNQHPPRIDFCVGRLIERPLGESNHPGIHPLQESVEGFGVGFWKIDLVIQCFFEQAVSGALEERRHLADELLVDGKRSLPLTNNYFDRGVVFVPGQRFISTPSVFLVGNSLEPLCRRRLFSSVVFGGGALLLHGAFLPTLVLDDVEPSDDAVEGVRLLTAVSRAALSLDDGLDDGPEGPEETTFPERMSASYSSSICAGED
jgi:hypothetical protein